MCALAPSLPYAAETAGLPEPQTRGYYFNLMRNLSATSLRLEVERVAAAGFNVIIFPAFTNGWTLFPSETARAYGIGAINPLFRKWNPFAEVIGSARDAGLAVWAFTRPYNFHPRHSISEHKLLRKHPRWRVRCHPEFQSAESRRYEERHPCPLNSEYQRYLADVLAEIATGYPVDGVVIHYSGFGLQGGELSETPYCFCQSCRRSYHDIHDADIVRDAMGGNIDRVRIWQFQESHEHLIYLRHRLMRSRRTLRMICWTPPLWRYGPARQLDPLRVLPVDWPTELASGSIDEVLVDHDGERCGPLTGARIAADYSFLGDRVLFMPVYMVDQIKDLQYPLETLGRYPTPGFIAQFQTSLSEPDARAIRERYLANPSLLPESEPIRTAVFLLDRVRLTHESQPVIHDLMHDFLRLLTRQLPHFIMIMMMT
ncbi:MAG: family 10 glycosylhydrolase, partial [bacterium]|nr:family 10 glycosylhydrolase [bacterium]